MNQYFTSILRTSMAAALIAALAVPASAQSISGRDVSRYLQKRQDGKNVSLFHRLELYYGVTFGGGSVNINDRFKDQSNFNYPTSSSRATTFNYRASAGGGGVYFPMSYFGNKSVMALSVGLYATASVWDIGNTSLESGRVVTNEAKDMYFGLPIGVDFIYGGEATLNKSNKLTLRAGAGLMPFFAVGELADGSQDYGKLGIRPYIKAELGFFAGMEWKIRAMVIPGSRTLYDYRSGDYNLEESEYYYNFKFKLRPTYSVGLVIFPFSFGWENDSW